MGIVERLRETAHAFARWEPVLADEVKEAADRIEALEAENARLREAVQAQKAERIRGGEMVKEAAGITAFGSLNVVDAGDRIRALSVPAIVEAGDA